MIAVTKLKTFDVSFSVMNIKLAGYEKPRNAHTPITKNTPASEDNVYFDSLVNGDNVRSENVECDACVHIISVEGC